MGWLVTPCVRIHLEALSNRQNDSHLSESWAPAFAGVTAYLCMNGVANAALLLYTEPIPDIVMSNNTEPEYGFEGEESYVRTPDA
jgi:hypothetical protein